MFPITGVIFSEISVKVGKKIQQFKSDNVYKFIEMPAFGNPSNPQALT